MGHLSALDHLVVLLSAYVPGAMVAESREGVAVLLSSQSTALNCRAVCDTLASSCPKSLHALEEAGSGARSNGPSSPAPLSDN